MNFVDKVTVTVTAGHGGNGKLSFRHEKYVNKGGPDGGDGGAGGDIIFKASRNQNTLTAFRYKKELRAEAGQSGERRKMHGKSGQDLVVDVPVGTIIATAKGEVMADLVSDGQEVIIAKGGNGGFGNAHFVSSRRQAPDFAEKGEPGETLELELELKMIADVGLVGLPNAGKSTLLAKVSNARPEIADYPFTTLRPNLGVIDIDKKTSILLADIPGLIAGAAEGRGLGHDFLRHIERTAVTLHLIDAYNAHVAKDYLTIRGELEAYSSKLLKNPEVVVLNKVEGLDQDIVDDLMAQLKQVAPKTPILAISAKSGQGIAELLYSLNQTVNKVRTKPKIKSKKPTLPVISLKETADSWKVKKDKKLFIVSGQKIERFAQRTDFTNEQAIQRLRNIMSRQGIMHELHRRGIESGQTVQIGADPQSKITY